MVSLNYLTKRSIFQQFTKSNFSLLFIAIILIIVGNFLTIFLPLSIGWFYELAFGEYGTKSSLLKHFPYRIQDLNSYFTLFIVLLFLRTGIAFCEKYAVGVLGERFSRDLREKTFDAQLHHSLSSHQLRPVGKYLLRYSGDLIAIQNLMSKGILLFLGDVSFLVLSTIVLFLINPYLAIPVVVWFSFSGFILFLLGTHVRNAAVERRTQRSLNLGFVSSRMNAFFTLKSFNRETPEQKSFNKRSNKLYKLSLKYIGISSLVKTLPSFFFYTMLGIVFYTTIQIEGDLLRHKSDVFAFVLLLLYMQSVLNRLLKVNIVCK